MNLHKARAEIQALREQLTKEKTIPFSHNLEEGIEAAVNRHVQHKLHIEEIKISLQALNELEAIIANLEAVAEREKQASETLQAERKQQAIELVDKLKNLDDGPEKSDTLAQIAELIN